MSALFNPLEQALVETCDGNWKLRSELCEELEPLADPATIETSIEFLIKRRLLERLAIKSIAYGYNTYATTNLGRRMLRVHNRRRSEAGGRTRRILRLV